MRKRYLILISIFFILQIPLSVGAQEQSPPPKPLKDRLFVGGNLGLQFGSYTYVEVAPLTGIHLTNFFDVGIGGIYTYSKNSLTNFTNQIYGANAFAQLLVIKPVMLHVQIETVNSGIYNLSGDISRQWFQSVLVGGGIRQPISERSYSFILILWDLNEGYNTPYQNPVIKVGFVF